MELFCDEHGQPLPIGPQTLLLFVDETGTETLNDPNYPVFGFGACAVLASGYQECLVKPWLALKSNLFDGINAPLHAADLRASKNQMSGLNRFFTTSQFARLAAVITDKTWLSNELQEWEHEDLIYELATKTFMNRLPPVLDALQPSDVLLVQEASQRTDHLAQRYFPQSSIRGRTEGEHASELAIRFAFMEKAQGEPGLEVADFVVHTAGTCIRARHKEGGSLQFSRADFDAVFKSGDPQLSPFFELTRVSDPKN